MLLHVFQSINIDLCFVEQLANKRVNFHKNCLVNGYPILHQLSLISTQLFDQNAPIISSIGEFRSLS